MEHASAAIDGNNTNQEGPRRYTCLRYLNYEANWAHGSLVDLGATVDIKSEHMHTAQQNIFVITTGPSKARTDLITQVPSTLYK
jgi:hypothetical protein